VGGSPYSSTEYGKALADTNAIFMFDLVFRNATTAITLPERTDFYLPMVQSAYAGTAGTSLWLGASLNYGAASTATPHMVCDEIDCIFIAQCKTGTTISTTSHSQKNANISLTTAGSTTTKQSGLAVDGATIGTTNTYDVRILKVATISPNAEGNAAILEVTINKHYFAQGSTAV
jgi:hypothetical protein